jgi:hypothetical protein
MAAWAGFEPADSGFTERARAQIRDGALYRPPRYRRLLDEAAGGGAQADPAAQRRRKLWQPFAGVDLEAVRLLEPEQEPDLVERERGQVRAADERRGADHPVPAGEVGDELRGDRAA